MLLLRLSALHYPFDYRIIASTEEHQAAPERPRRHEKIKGKGVARVKPDRGL